MKMKTSLLLKETYIFRKTFASREKNLIRDL